MGFKRDIEYAINEAYRYYQKLKIVPTSGDIQDYVVDWLCEKFDIEHSEADKIYQRETE